MYLANQMTLLCQKPAPYIDVGGFQTTEESQRLRARKVRKILVTKNSMSPFGDIVLYNLFLK